jgi:hypothetical protein
VSELFLSGLSLIPTTTSLLMAVSVKNAKSL